MIWFVWFRVYRWLLRCLLVLVVVGGLAWCVNGVVGWFGPSHHKSGLPANLPVLPAYTPARCQSAVAAQRWVWFWERTDDGDVPVLCGQAPTPAPLPPVSVEGSGS